MDDYNVSLTLMPYKCVKFYIVYKCAGNKKIYRLLFALYNAWQYMNQKKMGTTD